MFLGQPLLIVQSIMNNILRGKDYEDWDKVIAHCDSLEDLSQDERNKAKDAIQFLKEELGNNFLQKASKEKHPMFSTSNSKDIWFTGTKYSYIGTIRNIAPWTRKWITWLATAMKELKYQNNYSSLLERIKDKNRFIEAVSVLEIAYKLSKSGFSISVDPIVTVNGQNKQPDLKITDKYTGEQLFVEVSIQSVDIRQKEQLETLHTFTESLRRSFGSLVYAGAIYRQGLAKSHLHEIIGKVQEMAEESKRERFFQELVIEGIIEIAISIREDDDLLRNWSEKRGLKIRRFTMPDIQVDHIHRIKRKLAREEVHFPKKSANIVILRSDYIFFYQRDYRSIINEIEEEVFKYPHILAVIVFGISIGSENKIEENGRHLYIKKTYFDMLTYEYIILYNRFCEIMVSPVTTERIYCAFKNN
jgi:hypothetical protein